MTREQRLEKAQLKVLFNAPFFASGVSRLENVFTKDVETAVTDGFHIKWNPEWFDALTDDEIVTVYCEEVGHCMLGHLWRKPVLSEDKDDQDSWDKSCDAAVRCMMDDFGKYQTDRGLANPFPFPKEVREALDHSRYRDMAEEKIYSIIRNANRKQGGPNGKNPGKGPGSGPSFGEFEQQKKGDKQQQKNQNQWQDVLIQAAHMAKQRGTVPAGMERLINGMLKPEVPWQEILRALLREMANDDWNFMKPDIMLSDATGFIMPSLESEKMGAVVFAIDTSGSIDSKMLADFKTEEQACLDDMKPSSITEICCDSAIHRIVEWKKGQQVDDKAPGGGGTMFEPVFDHVQDKMTPLPKALVYLTDLQGSFPKEEPPYPVIWVCYNHNNRSITAPWGETVYVGN